MHGRQIRILFAALVAIVLVLILGCAQPGDITAPISSTKIYLSPAQLPSTPAGYTYELWTVDTTGKAYSLGKFFWDSYRRNFYDIDSSRLDSAWTVDYDLLNPFYKFIQVSIETNPDPNPDTTIVGPIMLRDTISVDPSINPIKMVFPIDFGISMAGFCLQTPTDKNSRSNEASGVWFALYNYDSIQIVDTTGVLLLYTTSDIRLEIDSTYWKCTLEEEGVCVESLDVTDQVLHNPGIDTLYDWIIVDTTNLDTLAHTLDTVAVQCKEQLIDSFYVYDTLLMDTFVHKTVTFDYVSMPVNISDSDVTVILVDTCTGLPIDTIVVPPFTSYNHYTLYFMQARMYLLDKFLSNYDEVPDLSNTKWHYKGWVISPYLPQDCDQLGHMTKPEWIPSMINQCFARPDQWRIISTGSFKNFDNPDDGNPYSLNLRVPRFPGEDFLTDLPCGYSRFVFADSIYRDSAAGEIFVTVEPDNYSENTNFPLILFSTKNHAPAYSEVSDTTYNHVQSFLFANRSGRVDNNPFGFPAIKVAIERQ